MPMSHQRGYPGGIDPTRNLNYTIMQVAVGHPVSRMPSSSPSIKATANIRAKPPATCRARSPPPLDSDAMMSEFP
jgi:hypothetical protein